MKRRLQRARKEATQSALARSRAFGLLARALRYPDEELFALLREGRWQKELSKAACQSAIGPLDPFLVDLRRVSEILPASLDDLQRIYTALFSMGGGCSHQESDYVASHAFQKADLMADVAGFYGAFGVRISSSHRELPDFIGTELEFLSLVNWKEARALRQGDQAAVEICRQVQKKFLAEHLAAWVGPYREKMESSPPGQFYALLAKLAESFVKAQNIKASRTSPGSFRASKETSEVQADVR